MKPLKCIRILSFLTLSLFALISHAQDDTADRLAKSDAEQEKKATEWIDGLQLSDKAKEDRLQMVISRHLKAVRNWHNSHPFTEVPAGINPATGNKLSELDRQMIADSAMPAEVHQQLMVGLRKDLTEPQVSMILDKYTVGKVAFTTKGYEAIVADLTAKEREIIKQNLEQAREQAVDYKSMKQISAIFEIYKTKIEQYFNANGRNWHQLFKTYVDGVKAKKAKDKKS
ncbi:DUF3826 domain-containing protein [Olivibacter domesticus]|uniref:DUF3826 domain-containing protein n=1 Tax=Olivibacter domesticus TaxID=407022 RepID=A0A1H7U0N2_OLID1|nr:DUF3826 domain-containing protein [Olivibacter domesticus]SEL90248.1 Protein of unknown function [Olivibacter domesticus]